jgi:hypothetical protein
MPAAYSLHRGYGSVGANAAILFAFRSAMGERLPILGATGPRVGWRIALVCLRSP